MIMDADNKLPKGKFDRYTGFSSHGTRATIMKGLSGYNAMLTYASGERDYGTPYRLSPQATANDVRKRAGGTWEWTGVTDD